jgi:hypothetical protein
MRVCAGRKETFLKLPACAKPPSHTRNAFHTSHNSILVLPPHHNATFAACVFGEFYLCGDAFFERCHVADDADGAVGFVLQAFEGGERRVEGFRIEAAKAFVYEEAVDAWVFSGQVRKSQRQRQAHHKTFAARECSHRVPLVAYALVVLVERIAVSRFLLLLVIEL